MTQEILDNNFQSEKMGKDNSTINVLTILTFIGSAIALISGIYGYFTAEKSLEMLNSMGAMPESGMSSVDNMMQQAVVMAQKQYENRYTILAVTIIGAILCILGALQMRKGMLKGLWIYLGGEWITPIITVVLIGVAGYLTILGFIVPAIFSALYLMHKKYLA